MARRYTTASSRRVFHTGHEVFDRIVILNHGSSYLVLDKTFSEAHNLMNFLMSKYCPPGTKIVEIRSTAGGPREAHIVGVVDSLTNISIAVNELRNANRRKVFFHVYLPSLLIRHDVNDVLKLLEQWVSSTYNSETVEFYFLPKDTFVDFEKKVLSIVDGAIELRIVESKQGFDTLMVPVRCCEQSAHLRQFRYAIREEKLLIELDGLLTERAPSPHQALQYETKLEAEMNKIMIERGSGPPPPSPSDYLLFSQVIGKRVIEIFHLFQDEWMNILEKLAQWASVGTIDLKEVPSVGVSKRPPLSRLNRLALSLPTSLSSTLIHLQKRELRRRRTVPLDGYVAMEKAAQALCEIVAPELEQGKDLLKQTQLFFGQLAGRVTGVQYLSRLEGDPTAVIPQDKIPKIISLILYSGFGLRSRIAEDPKGVFRVTIRNCIFCESAQPGGSCCEGILTGTLAGTLGVCFKRRFTCYESECVVMGGKECTLRIEALPID